MKKSSGSLGKNDTPLAVVDASIVVKWFVEEEGSEKALEVRDRYVEGEMKLIAPEILVFEVLNALYYKKLFSEADMEEVSEALDSYSFNLYSLKGRYMKKTIEVAFENAITIYDASYVSLAIMKSTYLYTADRKLIDGLREEYSKYVRLI
ncbi:MAG: type II toxin-antitoxin system VapC family toxin [Candidatus Brockarchaeota archaeon]|nr:type II toxin-antitoxin system VapC family toxin [Candidatus Brockarchaeota archaeon]